MFVNNLINSNRSCTLVVPRMLRDFKHGQVNGPNKQFLLRVGKQYFNEYKFSRFEKAMQNGKGLVKPSQRIIARISYQFDLVEMEFRNK